MKKKNLVYLAVCAIIKNEGKYIREWIEFHKIVGVEKFYIYDHGSADNAREILAPYVKVGDVVLIPWQKTPVPAQNLAYEHCLNNLSSNAFWIAFIDLDEFLFGTHENDLRLILKEYENYGGVMVGWHNFGSSGHMAAPRGLVIENFTRRASLIFSGRRNKSIVNTSLVMPVKPPNPHCFYYREGHCAVDEKKALIPASKENDFGASIPLSVDRLRINHYMVKSKNEYSTKRLRGLPNRTTLRPEDFFSKYDRNEELDLTIQRFVALLKSHISSTVCLQNESSRFDMLKKHINDKKSAIKRSWNFGAVFFISLLRNNLFVHTRQSVYKLDSIKKTVAVIISCYGQLDYTKKAIESYYASLDDQHNYVLLVMDDCSLDATEDYFLLKEGSGLKNCCYFRYKKNVGLTQTWNDGIQFALDKLKADFVFLINNDILIPKGTFARMLAHFSDPKVGVVGPLSNAPGIHGLQDIRLYCKSYKPSSDRSSIESVNEQIKDHKPLETMEVNGFFMGFSKAAFIKNIFYNILRPYYFDPRNRNFKNEREFQQRLRQVGLKSLIAKDAFVFHYKDISQQRHKDKSTHLKWMLFRDKKD